MRTVELDAYVLETLMADLVGHDRQPSAFLVYLFLWSRGGREEGGVQVSLRAMAEGTGLSRRAVQDAVGRLLQRRLATVERASLTTVPRYRVLRPWVRGEAAGAGDPGNPEVMPAP